MKQDARDDAGGGGDGWAGIFVADASNSRVLFLEDVMTLGGSAHEVISRDFSRPLYPCGLWMDGSRNRLYVAENERRKGGMNLIVGHVTGIQRVNQVRTTHRCDAVASRC
jgi:hypothetical protein